MSIPFNIPHLCGQELFYIKSALRSGRSGGDGMFVERCSEWFTENYQVPAAFMTHSCTGALEMAALVAGIESGDEVIVPSFTHVSTANAFALRGATIVFADSIAETMTIDIVDVLAKITTKTKAIVVVHYGGYAADVVQLRQICDEKGILLIEDAAHSIGAKLNGKHHGTFGHMGCISFHETKNIQCGEGGVLLINESSLIPLAEMVYEKGTNRTAFLRGEATFYEWQCTGSSFAMSNISAAMLLAQLQETEDINYRRAHLWTQYHNLLSNVSGLENLFELPPVPVELIEFNAHVFFLRAKSAETATQLVAYLSNKKIAARFHYQPLHLSPFAKSFPHCHCSVAESNCNKLVRLPLFAQLNSNQVKTVVEAIEQFVISVK